MSIIFLLPILIVVITIATISLFRAMVQNTNSRVRSSDGHLVKPSEDLTCDQYGHHHPESKDYGNRYIVHNDPEEGYVVLNGIRHRITDCKNL